MKSTNPIIAQVSTKKFLFTKYAESIFLVNIFKSDQTKKYEEVKKNKISIISFDSYVS